MKNMQLAEGSFKRIQAITGTDLFIVFLSGSAYPFFVSFFFPLFSVQTIHLVPQNTMYQYTWPEMVQGENPCGTPFTKFTYSFNKIRTTRQDVHVAEGKTGRERERDEATNITIRDIQNGNK